MAPSSIPKRARNLAGTMIEPRLPTLADSMIVFSLPDSQNA
jgi:hypothetical protein